MVALDTSYDEYRRIEAPVMAPKQKGGSVETIMIGNQEATTVNGAARILTERAKQMGIDRTYSRDTVYRLLIDHKVGAIRTPSANYYFVEDLNKVPLHPHKGKPRDRKNYPQEIKEQARELHSQGFTQRAIAEKLGVRFQTVGYWLRKSILLV